MIAPLRGPEPRAQLQPDELFPPPVVAVEPPLPPPVLDEVLPPLPDGVPPDPGAPATELAPPP
jgi:hypothetical protein